MHRESLTYIVVLNWNNWGDTIECLESVLRLDCPRFRVIVCDNQSEDGSVEIISEWVKGKVCAIAESSSMKQWIMPPVDKPIDFQIQDYPAIQKPDCRLTILRTGANRGFAGGCNTGIKLALQDKACTHVWLLNNDTIACPDTLRNLLDEMSAHPDMGLCGSLLYYYHSPDKIQAAGGRYQRWLGTSGHISLEEYEKGGLDYVVGASMLVSRDFLEKVGMMDESYFLYYEENDWAVRGKKHFQIGTATKSIVFHKEGASTKAGSRFGKRQSPLADFYGMRNRLLFGRKHFPHYYPFVWLATTLPIIKRLLRGEFSRAWRVLTLMWNPNQDYQSR
ncbi:glycosyltransferase family 2 protein [Pseudogulbenkiania sp. MAI-1]|uniref:glycosyltransferase family 2 protein n=1 Tax=Pseudogulbenkiania sp. MAI-1 TaxID=990370 RepID=UPI000A073A46|nr:glycosyltransferase family 2 protein [Pseudogulbenkiania sp. MAI-1]